MAGRLWVGTAGWSYADWSGRVYPDPPPRGFRPLEYLTRYFDCVEVNVTYYRVPDLRTVAGWVRQVQGRPDFRFFCKLHQQFTHRHDPWGPLEIRQYLEPLAPLRESGRLLGLLVQLPWSARFDDATRERLARIADGFGSLPLILEVRHASWDQEGAREWIRRRGFDYCNIDQPALRDCLVPSDHATGATGYVRFHGRNRAAWFAKDAGRDRRYDYYYSAGELEEWVPRIQRLLFELPNVYVIANNHYRGQGPANALQVRARLEQRKVDIPPDLVRAFPDLVAIAAGGQPPPRTVQPGLFDVM